ncbi:MAG: CBS domain-containing protein [Pseudomonadota bacterium]
MDVITTHINADFDSVASMLAAKKLYPHAKLAFPGSQEKGLRDFFLQSTIYMLQTERIKDIEFDKITRLILVDIRQKDRIGRFKEILDTPGLEVHIYDHHPPTENDISGSVEVTKEVGATTTILCQILQEKKIEITPDEATIMMMGIYEDTGSLTFTSTTQEDFYAAAFLLSKGANLNVVSDIVSKELTAEQISILYELINTASVHTINGVEVVIAKTSMDKYVSDFAVLVHKLRDMENINVLFALGEMEGRIYLVARSRLKEVDVSKVAVEFGGGGHSTAASATIKNYTLPQVEERLKQIIKKKVNPLRTAADIMSSPVITINADETIKTAGNLLARYQLSTLPVMNNSQVVGLISRPIIDRAMYHNLENLPVKEYMVTEFYQAKPDTPLNEIQRIIVEGNQGFLPVVRSGDLAGVITRTDILRLFRIGPKERPQKIYDFDYDLSKVSKKRLFVPMKEQLPKSMLEFMEEAGQMAEKMGYQAFVVGGFVRDILLRYKNLDLDIVIEGDGIKFAKALLTKYKFKATYHRKFGTAQILTPEGFKIDVASARREYYESPAALPVVELSSIRQDLYRRDFTINTLALHLNPGHFGEMIDFFGGRRDIKNRVIKVIHSLSFVEDPTRIFRALRFEQRFGFSISKETANLINNAVKMGIPPRLSRHRMFGELQLILQENDPPAIIKRMADFDLLKFFHPRIKYDRSLKELMGSINEVLTWFELLFLNEEWEKWRVYLLGMVDGLNDEEFLELSKKLAFLKKNIKKVLSERNQAKNALKKIQEHKSLANSIIYELLNPLSIEALLYIMAKTNQKYLKKSISNYIAHLRFTEVMLTGKDLKAMGLPPGKVYQQVLKSLLKKRLDGNIKTREDEIMYVKKNFLSCG